MLDRPLNNSESILQYLPIVLSALLADLTTRKEINLQYTVLVIVHPILLPK